MKDSFYKLFAQDLKKTQRSTIIFSPFCDLLKVSKSKGLHSIFDAFRFLAPDLVLFQLPIVSECKACELGILRSESIDEFH